MHADVALTVALALAAGVAVQCAARLVRVPAIILLLATGILLGPSGLAWVRPAELGGGLFVIVDFAVAVILFEGALNLDIARLRREERAIRRLVTWGAAVTLIGGTMAARAWMGWDWPLAVLFGSLVVVTGPTVIGPLVRDLRLRPRLKTILEAEGVLIDPIGALVAVLALQLALSPHLLGVASEGWDLLLRLIVGTTLGAGGGLVIAGLLRLPTVVHGLENVLVLALVTLLFFLGEHFVSQSGLLAVTVAGLVVGNLKSAVDEDLREFKDQITILLIGAIFILLAADIGIADVRALGWRGLGVLLTLILVVRPLGVWLSTIGTGLAPVERSFLSSVAPRGIVAAAIASLTAEALSGRGLAGGGELRALVFLVIGGTVVAAGALAWPLSTLLGLRLAARDRVAILGAQGLGLALGAELRRAGSTVVFIDSDPQRCRQAEALDFPVVFGDALQERTLRRVPIELVGTAIGMTFNDNLNSQFAGLARQTFGVKVGLVSVDSLDGGGPPEHVARHGARVLFEGAHEQERWDVRWRQREVVVEPFEHEPTEPADDSGGSEVRPGPDRQEAFVLLTMERSGRIEPVWLGYAPRRGDRVAVAYFTAWRERALTQLAGLGWRPVVAPAGDAAGADQALA